MRQISFGQMIHCPTSISNSQPKKNFTLGRGSMQGFYMRPHDSKVIDPLKKARYANLDEKNPELSNLQMCKSSVVVSKKSCMMSHNWKYSNSPITDRPPSTSFGQRCSWKASVTDRFKNFRGTAENTIGAMSLMQHPKSHLSVQKMVLFPLPIWEIRPIEKSATTLGWTGISSLAQDLLLSVLANHS